VRTTPGKRKLRKADNSVLGLHSCERTQKITRDRRGDSKSTINLVCSVRAICTPLPLLAVSCGTP
jgi:hypothetical protein